MNKKVYIIILNYNGWKDTIECLESVLKSDYQNYQIVLVDNDSSNHSMDYIISWAEGKQEVIYDENSQLKHLSQPFEPKPLSYVYYTKEEALAGGDASKENDLNNPLIFIQAGENGGFAVGNNIGIKYALAKGDFEYIWLLNNDTVIEKNVISTLIKNIKKNNKNIYGTILCYYNNPNIIQAIGGGRLNNIFGIPKMLGKMLKKESIQYLTKNQRLDFITGASIFISKEILNDIGLIPENYFMYWEDTDWSFKAINKNYIIDVAYTFIYHKEGNSIGYKSFKQQRLDLLNTLKFYYKYRPYFLLTIMILKPIYNVLSRIKGKHGYIFRSYLLDLKTILSFFIKLESDDI